MTKGVAGRPKTLWRSTAVWLACCATALSSAAAQTSAQRPADWTLAQAAVAFGSRETVMQASLSPDGALFATIESDGARGALVKILDLTSADSTPVAITGVTGDPDQIDWCRWSGMRRLLCAVHVATQLDTGDIAYATRLIGMDADGKRQQMLRFPSRNGMAYGYRLFGGSVIDWNTGADGHVLMIRQYLPEFSTGTRVFQTAEGLGVDDVNTNNLSVATILKAKREAREYITDGQGSLRIMGTDPEMTEEGYSSAKRRYAFRPKGKTNWVGLSDYNIATGEGFNPYYVDPQLDIVYGLKKVNGRDAAFSKSLDGKGTEQLILSRDDVDVDGFARIGRNGRVIGVSYETDRPEVVYTDDALKRLATGLSKGLPNLPLIRFIDSSQDERKLLIWAGSDVDPGRYYLLDRDTRGLTELAFSRPMLRERPLAAVKSVQVKAADGTLIPAYLTLPPGSDGKNLPAIVMPHGGPSARDSWGFDWLPQFWASRGYAVLQPNFRGSSGYGDSWFQNNGFRGWRTAIGDVADSGRWLVQQGIADPHKLVVMGWSYGGYAALQSAVTDPDLFRAVVAIAPVTDLGRLKQDSANWSNYLVTRDFIGSGPHIEDGSPARQAAKIKAPVLMFHGTYDVNVGIKQSQLMADRLKAAGKSGRLVTYDKLDHYLEDSAARQDMLMQSATFLEQSLAGK